jgi:hypothetical protein
MEKLLDNGYRSETIYLLNRRMYTLLALSRIAAGLGFLTLPGPVAQVVSSAFSWASRIWCGALQAGRPTFVSVTPQGREPCP